MIPKVSFIISVFDQLDYTKRCLSCLEKTLKDKLTYEVLIVDDGSNEETIHYLHSLEEPHHVTFNSERKGFAKNNNLAASRAKGEYLCLFESLFKPFCVNFKNLQHALPIILTKEKRN